MNTSIISIRNIIGKILENIQIARMKGRLTARQRKMKAIKTVSTSLALYFVNRFEA
jgi:hypothetical protein